MLYRGDITEKTTPHSQVEDDESQSCSEGEESENEETTSAQSSRDAVS